ncbi:serine hydrolase domain-containing protein [Acidobacteriota bacterium]
MKIQGNLLKLVGIFVSIAMLSMTAVADTKSRKVDKLFAEWDSTVTPGGTLGIIKDGKFIYKRGYGMANLEHNIPITTTSVFRIGSFSKQFAAACIAILSMDGKISLDDNIRKYVPEIPEYEKPITIRHLIHHTSGLRDYTYLLLFAGQRPDGDCPTIQETIDAIARQKALNFLPGEEFSYSNSGYFLLSIIVERATGKSLNEFAQERIFKPLGMTNTHFHDDHTMIVKQRADGYSPTENGFRINMSNWNHVGDGSVFTSIEDLLHWDQAFYNNKLGKEFLELVHTRGVLNSGEQLDYAFGLRVSEYRGLKTVSHGGAWVGFRTMILRFPEQQFSVIILSNLGTFNPSELSYKVADIYLDELFTEEPKKKKEEEAEQDETPITIAIPPEKLREYTGQYFSEELMTTFKLAIEEGALLFKQKNAWEDPLKATAPDNFISGPMTIKFQRDKKNRISGFSLNIDRIKDMMFIKK